MNAPMDGPFLFLGGSQDGKRLRIPNPGYPYTVQHPIPGTPEWQDTATIADLPIRVEVYRPTGIGGSRTRFLVYALDGWTGDDVVDRLVNGSRAAEGGRGQRLGWVQRVRVSPRWNEEESKKLEARMIADVAGKAHENGLRFTDWPTVERRELTYANPMYRDSEIEHETRPGEKADLIEFRVSVVAVPR